MDQQPPPPPSNLKPWYYQDWFLFPVVVFWPVWSVLILRSPWHNGLVSGAVAWALLIVGGYAIIWEQLVQAGRLNQLTITLVVPGLLLTVATQALWFRDRPKLRDRGQEKDSPPVAATSSRAINARDRHQGRRRRPRSRRSSRGQ